MAAGKGVLHETPGRHSRPDLVRLASALTPRLSVPKTWFFLTCLSDKFHVE